jgi:hypothetical protein
MTTTHQDLPITLPSGTIIPSKVWKDEFGTWHWKAKYPKMGRSHFYSFVNYVDDLFAEQYPEWQEFFRKQSRGEL